jgi:hypothetical protein
MEGMKLKSNQAARGERLEKLIDDSQEGLPFQEFEKFCQCY